MTILKIEIDEETAKRARKRATLRGKSLEAEIVDFVESMSGEAERSKEARHALADLFRKSSLSADCAPMSREEIYAERFSRYEHSDLRSDRQDG